jgi:hypothetical protein
MTDQPPAADNTSDLVSQLRDEMQAQFAQLKSETDALIAAQKEQIAALEKDKASLQAALVRSATSPPEKAPEPEKTEEEIYREQVDALAEKGLAKMKQILTE